MHGKIDENYDYQEHTKLILGQIKRVVGDGCYPSNKEIIEFWKTVTTPMPPRTYMYIIQSNQDVCFRSKGFSVLGLPDSWSFTWNELLKITHANQFILVAYQTLFLYEAFFNYKDDMKEKGVVYCTSRGVRDFNSEDGYYLVHQVGYPIQYDENGYVSKYFCCFRVLGDYNGEALETQVFTDSKYQETQKKLRAILDLSKKNMLGVLKFTKAEQEIINYMAYTDLKIAKQIADHLEVSIRTITNQKTSINKKAKKVFPLNNFRGTQDVVDYLKKQRII